MHLASLLTFREIFYMFPLSCIRVISLCPECKKTPQSIAVFAPPGKRSWLHGSDPQEGGGIYPAQAGAEHAGVPPRRARPPETEQSDTVPVL